MSLCRVGFEIECIVPDNISFHDASFADFWIRVPERALRAKKHERVDEYIIRNDVILLLGVDTRTWYVDEGGRIRDVTQEFRASCRALYDLVLQYTTPTLSKLPVHVHVSLTGTSSEQDRILNELIVSEALCELDAQYDALVNAGIIDADEANLFYDHEELACDDDDLIQRVLAFRAHKRRRMRTSMANVVGRSYVGFSDRRGAPTREFDLSHSFPRIEFRACSIPLREYPEGYLAAFAHAFANIMLASKERAHELRPYIDDDLLNKEASERRKMALQERRRRDHERWKRASRLRG